MGRGTMTDLEIARRGFEFHANVLARSLGRNRAPIDLNVARDELPTAQAALQCLAELLNVRSDV
jgi:hypothetical protein